MNDVAVPGAKPMFGTVLRGYRRGFGLTQEELGGLCGISDRAIRDLEHGRVRRPRRATVDLLSGALGLAGVERDRFRDLARGRP